MYQIIKVGDPILREKAAEVRRFNKNLHDLLDGMLETLRSCGNGVGIAAPQVGVSKRVVVMEIDDEVYELVNPVIVSKKGRDVDIEGCLSVPNRHGKVTRAARVKVEAQDRFGNPYTLEAKNLVARCMQHECDHLDGVLFIDVMSEEVEVEE